MQTVGRGSANRQRLVAFHSVSHALFCVSVLSHGAVHSRSLGSRNLAAVTCSSMTGCARCPQANYLGSAVVNNVNVLDLLLGQGKQDLNNQGYGQGYHQRKLNQIYPDRTGYQQTGFKNVQVPRSASTGTLTLAYLQSQAPGFTKRLPVAVSCNAAAD